MKLRTAFLWTSAILLVIALVGLVYLGTFTRYLADDFCMAGDAIHLGLTSMLVKWYTTWTGRFMYIITSGLFSLAGPKFAGWRPPVAAAVWLFGIYWALLPLVRRARWPKPSLLAFGGGSLILLVLFSSIPNLFQSFFWQDGMLNYSLALIGLTYCCGMILRVWLDNANIYTACIVVFILAFVSGGFSETAGALEITLFALALLLSLTIHDPIMRKRLLIILLVALFAALAAYLVVYLAPGNQVRMQTVGGQSAHPGLLRILTFSTRNMTHIIGKYLLLTPFWAVLSFILPFLAGWLFSDAPADVERQYNISFLVKQDWVRGILFTGISALILVIAACAPVVYVLNAYPNDRTLITPLYAVVVSIVIISALSGFGFRKLGLLPNPLENPTVGQALPVVILIIVAIAAGSSLWHTSNQLPNYHSYRDLWDSRAAEIQQYARSGQTVITVPGNYSMFYVADLATDPNNWVNRCMAYYYGLSQIIGK